MSAEVRRRLAALERSPETHGEPLTFIIRFVSPGEPEGELSSLRDTAGLTVERMAGESEAAFIDRAAALARGADGGPLLLLEGT